MSDKALVIAISVILSLVLGAGIYFLVKPATPQIAPGQTPGEKGRPGPFDDNDSPIIIAGGSLYLSTAPGYDLGTMDSKGLYFDYNGTSIKNRYVSFVEITDSNGVVTPFANVNSATPFSLMIDYNGGILAGSDPVTVSYMPVSGCGVITITNEKM